MNFLYASGKIVVAISTLYLIGCGSSGSGLDRQSVSGTVTIDNQPLEKALITFIPQGKTPGPKTSTVVEAGKFSMPTESGPCAGEHLVKFETISPEIEALASGDYHALQQTASQQVTGNQSAVEISSKYNQESTTVAIISSNGTNQLKFEIESAKRK